MGNNSTKQKTIPTNGDSSPRPPQPGTITVDGVIIAASKNFQDAYKVGRDLGSGAFSVVKLATHKIHNKQVAVKIVSKKKLSEEDLAALMTEISILCELDHPHIIKCYETFDEGEDFFIITELVAGGELFDRIVAKTHYTEKEARDLIKLFLETMAYMHENGIVHRDLKPENLLLTSDADDADIKVADFGFAKKVTELLPNETACGTPGYVAPEILRGDHYGCEVDIWSMGVICYVLLAGYPPFYDDDQRKLFRKIKEGKYHFHQDYWGSTSPEAIDMIRKMLCVSQKDRWTAKQLLAHPWILLGEDVLKDKDMTQSLETLKKYRARQRFKKVGNAIRAVQKVKLLLRGVKSAAAECASEGEIVDSMKEPTALKDINVEGMYVFFLLLLLSFVFVVHGCVGVVRCTIRLGGPHQPPYSMYPTHC